MEFPYEKYKSTKEWKVVSRAIKDLIKNKDIELYTKPDYVVGYICKQLSRTTKTALVKKVSVKEKVRKNRTTN